MSSSSSSKEKKSKDAAGGGVKFANDAGEPEAERNFVAQDVEMLREAHLELVRQVYDAKSACSTLLDTVNDQRVSAEVAERRVAVFTEDLAPHIDVLAAQLDDARYKALGGEKLAAELRSSLKQHARERDEAADILFVLQDARETYERAQLQVLEAERRLATVDADKLVKTTKAIEKRVLELSAEPEQQQQQQQQEKK